MTLVRIFHKHFDTKFMRLIILILFTTFFLSSFSQRMLTDSTFYDNGKLKRFGKYDSFNNNWRLYGFYETGQIESTRKLSPVYFWDIDTAIIYHRNGKLAWIFPYTDSGHLNGKLTGYYKDGSIKREAYYYRGFRTGTWIEYYQKGKTKSISYYEITQKDSAFVFHLPPTEFEKYRLDSLAYIQNHESEYFSWGEKEPNDTFSYNGVIYGGTTKFTTATLISKKTGKWKTFDSSGKIRDKRFTNFDSTYMVRMLILHYGLSFETVKEIYEKSNSFEALAQMLRDNDYEYNMTEFLKNWNEEGATFLKFLNEPRLALGLSRLTFKKESGEKIQKPKKKIKII